ncbi:hypothetical protein LTR91_017958 [Friedmanniomyces endolithicus]|uniref:Rab-GAP TBC domain-containing protein n=1 Tax=Friedmanniomyces endolithicus TaxID=329885 RepID=A0AAN6K5D1_9PEZI|nr:hypothetical protein LTR91_017958 [Friedmanniomyces endolithicus]
MTWVVGAGLPRESSLSVTEGIAEAMDTPQGLHYDSTRTIPEPHLPLRKASAQRLKSKHAPTPLFAPSQHHQVRGFNPSPVQPLPRIDATTASSEHAFAGRDTRRPSKLPLGSLVMRQGQARTTSHREETRSSLLEDEAMRPPSSPLLPPPPRSPRDKRQGLRGSRSLGEGLRGWTQRLSSNTSGTEDGRNTPDSMAPRPSVATDGTRKSSRSALTSHDSYRNTSSINTEGSSLIDGNSSTSEFVNVYPHWPDTAEEKRESLTVDDAIGMYSNGFDSAKESMDTHGKRSLHVDRPSAKESLDTQRQRSLQAERPTSQPPPVEKSKHIMHRRSQSASLLDMWTPTSGAGLLPPGLVGHQKSSAYVADMGGVRSSQDNRPASTPPAPEPVPRDRHGFKKVSHYITADQYNAWNVQYSEHIDRRRKKWHALMRSYGLDTKKPFRFPPKSDKIKRYVRKGIPQALRGAAWFWYAGGPSRVAKEPDLYRNLLDRVEKGELSDNDRETIERDLNRTFPDNIRFKPDPTTTSDVQAGVGGGKKRKSVAEPETPIVRALRRVLQTFAVHNPGIGYCQSLNFIAGLLLIFLDEDEEKAFVLLEIVTSVHLPGTHGVTLEGANIDIAVLMSCVKDSLPAIWEKLDDKGGIPAGDPSASALRLPTVSLATTAWFMSLFVGTLPIESVLRVWDCLFFEGSKTFFRIALAIFKAGERQILAVSDPMEIFQVVQTIPRAMLDVNGLMEELIERRREERRRDVRLGVAGTDAGVLMGRWKGTWRSRTRV